MLFSADYRRQKAASSPMAAIENLYFNLCPATQL